MCTGRRGWAGEKDEGRGGGLLPPQGARLNHRARLRRIFSSYRHTHCSVLWVRPVEKGRTDVSRGSSECCSASAAGDSEARREGGRKNTSPHQLPYCRNLVYGEICNSAVATQADMEEYLRRVQSRLGVSWEPSAALTPGCGYNEWDHDGKAATAVLQAAFLLLEKRTANASHVPSVFPPPMPTPQSTCRSPVWQHKRKRTACLVQYNKHVVFTGTPVCEFEWGDF